MPMPHKQILDNLSDAVVLLDSTLNIEYMNPAAEMLFDASIRQLRKRTIEEWLSNQQEDIDLLKQALEHQQPYTRREVKMRSQSNQELTVDYSVNPLRLQHSHCLLVELQARDRLIRIEREEEMLNRHNSARNLVRNLAHEIKNPLGGLRGAAQLLERELPDESLHDYTQIIIEEADRLRNLVDRLLGPRDKPKIEPLNIHAILERVCNLIDAECGGQINLIRDYDPSLPEFDGDAEQLIQAVLNIMRNAMQALQNNAIEQPQIILRTRAMRQVTLGSERHRLACCVELIDNGPGIPEQILNKLFYPMVSGNPQGHGLGLSIAQSIINQHQGLIECTSEPGQTCFQLLIPLEQQHDTSR